MYAHVWTCARANSQGLNKWFSFYRSCSIVCSVDNLQHLLLPSWTETCCSSSRHSRESKDSAPCNTETLTVFWPPHGNNAFSLFCHPLLLRVNSFVSRNLDLIVVSLARRWSKLHSSGAICDSVCSHSSERFLQCAINEGRGTMKGRSRIALFESDLSVSGSCWTWGCCVSYWTWSPGVDRCYSV